MIPYIIFSITGVLALLLVKEDLGQNRQIIFLCSIIMVVIGVYTLADLFIMQPAGSRGKENFLSIIPWLEIGLYISMLMGMASKYVYDVIDNKNKKKIKLNKWQLIRPFLVSPVVFIAIYSMIPESDSAFLLLLFSFQNGFFWQTVLYKMNPNSMNKIKRKSQQSSE